MIVSMTLVAWLGHDVWPIARRGYLLSRHLQSGEKKLSFLVGTRSGGEADGYVALLRE
jgi:hypothetical protein